MAEKIEVILVDIGSSIIKSAEVFFGEIRNRRTWKSINELESHYSNFPRVVSSVRNDQEQLKNLFIKPGDLVLTHLTKIPIELDYDTPETLGADRIALGVGANNLFPNDNNLIIDLGTCMTIDLVTEKGIFHGGAISPGLTMRMKAMAQYTHSLPDISDEWKEIPHKKYARSTKESLVNGSFKGILNEIDATIQSFQKDFASINIILTGGDSKYFDSHLKAHIFAGSKMVETGLYHIWKYQ